MTESGGDPDLALVVDTETTGMGPNDVVVELGCARVERARGKWRVSAVGSTLCNPASVPVCAEARANHHLTDAELADAPSFQECVGPLLSSERPAVFVAHNAEFDARLLAQSAEPAVVPPIDEWICTVRCARHLYPDAPSHGNQVLRYWLNLQIPPKMLGNLPPHRALPDAVVTAHLLARMLEEFPSLGLNGLLTKSRERPVLKTCYLGKYKGRPWSEVDSGMLRWVLGRDFNEDIKHTARHWLAQRGD